MKLPLRLILFAMLHPQVVESIKSGLEDVNQSVELAKEARECMEKIRESSAEVAKAMS